MTLMKKSRTRPDGRVVYTCPTHPEKHPNVVADPEDPAPTCLLCSTPEKKLKMRKKGSSSLPRAEVESIFTEAQLVLAAPPAQRLFTQTNLIPYLCPYCLTSGRLKIGQIRRNVTNKGHGCPNCIKRD